MEKYQLVVPVDSLRHDRRPLVRSLSAITAAGLLLGNSGTQRVKNSVLDFFDWRTPSGLPSAACETLF